MNNMASPNSLLSGHPLLLGFEHFERLLERTARTADSYPPYNVEEDGENGLKIVLAVAGFAPDELAVTVENNQLVIRGRRNDTEERSYLPRGIATRQFQRSFVLADGITITGADLQNGLLTIALERPEPESKVQTIPIRSETNGSGRGKA